MRWGDHAMTKDRTLSPHHVGQTPLERHAGLFEAFRYFCRCETGGFLGSRNSEGIPGARATPVAGHGWK